jgi:hypothetical protein
MLEALLKCLVCKLRLKDYKSEVSLCYKARPCLKTNKQIKRTRMDRTFVRNTGNKEEHIQNSEWKVVYNLELLVNEKQNKDIQISKVSKYLPPMYPFSGSYFKNREQNKIC